MPDYVALFQESKLAGGDATTFFALFLLGICRMVPIIAFSPFFGARVLPQPVKMAFAVTLFVVFMPKMLEVITRPVVFDYWYIMLAIKEIFVGFSLGFVMGAPFMIVQNAGMIIDHQKGGASLLVNDPTIQNQSSPLGTLFNMVLIYIFFLIDGPFYFMNAIIHAYDMVPPDMFISPLFFNEENGFWKAMLAAYNMIMVISAQLGAPALIAILMTDMFLGIANRLAPQVQITFLGLPLKSLLALTVICVGWKLMNKEMVTLSFQWLNILNSVINAFVVR